MPVNDIESAYQDGYTLAPPSKQQIKAGLAVLFAAAIYSSQTRPIELKTQ
jgi:hypothetical protein